VLIFDGGFGEVINQDRDEELQEHVVSEHNHSDEEYAVRLSECTHMIVHDQIPRFICQQDEHSCQGIR